MTSASITRLPTEEDSRKKRLLSIASRLRQGSRTVQNAIEELCTLIEEESARNTAK
jgi:hypothetical protein